LELGFVATAGFAAGAAPAVVTVGFALLDATGALATGPVATAVAAGLGVEVAG
jgi:hypothetical protein